MSLPPGFLDDLRTRLSLTDVVGKKVVWDARKSNQAKGDMWAPCPFHQEKTASFHVDDRKGFYYCFGCHQKGDAISFVRETENVGFMEAVQILAGEAGMPVPERDPEAQKKADRRTQLAEVMEAAVRHYRMQLKTSAAAESRDYLARRGLDEAAQERFEVGYAPDARQGVFTALTEKGIAPDLIIDAGLAAKPEDGGAPYDRFRGRILFPIRDARGRCIGLGGRSLDPNARAKYLNSPETEIFDKGRSLYNHAPAREAAGKGAPLIVAEGYMDVIALVQAGLGASVAPLGTAITEDQLRLLWRISPEPIVALDGDRAGVQAAIRLMDLALPLIEAGQSLRFAIMPEGQDPDDIIRAGGKSAMQALLDAAEPMVSLLWRRETEGKVFDSPERRAALDKSLREALRKIADPSLRRHYGDEVNQRRRDLFTPKRRAFVQGGNAPRKAGTRWQPPPPGANADTKGSLLAAASGAVEDHLREAVILAILLAHPGQADAFMDELERMDFSDPDHSAIRDALVLGAPDTDREKIAEIVGQAALEKLLRPGHVHNAPALRSVDPEFVALCLTEELTTLSAHRGARAEIEDAIEDMGEGADEGLTWRLSQAAEALNGRGPGTGDEDRTEFDTGPNGARIDKDERSAFQALLDKIGHGKGAP